LHDGLPFWFRGGVPPVPIRWLSSAIRQAAQAFLATDLNACPGDILAWFVSRWQVEVTFAEVRAHLGVETQRQWSDKASLRTTPVLLGLFSSSRSLGAFALHLVVAASLPAADNHVRKPSRVQRDFHSPR